MSSLTSVDQHQIDEILGKADSRYYAEKTSGIVWLALTNGLIGCYQEEVRVEKGFC